MKDAALDRGDSAQRSLLLLILLAVALPMRIAVLDWGLPPSTPEVAHSDIRSSYSFDEDDILTPISFTKPSRWDLDARQYQWGALHLELVLGTLQAAQRLLYFDHPWREAYYKMLPGDFERVYVAGRMASVLASLASVACMFYLALEYAGAQAAFWASLLVAVSPAHVLASTQIRADITMTALVTLAAWLGVRAQRSGAPRGFVWLGVAAGAAVAAKYPAIFMVIPLLAVTLRPVRFAPRQTAATLAGATAGFLLGEPYLLVRPREIAEQVLTTVSRGYAIPAGFKIPAAELLRIQGVNAVRFVVGPPAALLAIAGLIILLRRRAAGDWIPVAMLAGGVAGLLALLWPMLRYDLPLLPMLALAAAVALDRFPSRWRAAAGVLALIMPLAASADQVRFMREPHPANLMLAAVLRDVSPGARIARLMAELPPLDRKIYPMGSNPLLDNLSADPPAWVLLTDLPDRAYPDTTTCLLRTQYDLRAEFSKGPRFAWATLGAGGAPHDWKYTHPRLALYQRRTP